MTTSNAKENRWIEQESMLRDLVDKGLSAEQIAQRLGVTRSAVIGKCHRIGLKLKGKRVGANSPIKIKEKPSVWRPTPYHRSAPQRVLPVKLFNNPSKKRAPVAPAPEYKTQAQMLNEITRDIDPYADVKLAAKYIWGKDG